MKTKYLIGLIAASLAGSVFAETKPSFAYEKPAIASAVTVATSTTSAVLVRPFCRFGLQFLASTLDKSNTTNGSGGTSIIQVFADSGRPMPCKEDIK